MSVLDTAIRKSGAAISRVPFLLLLSVIAVLGLVWLSIALTELLALVAPPPWAPAITGVIFLALAALGYLLDQSARKRAKPSALTVSGTNSEELITRATRLAERMAPDSPMMALTVAVAAGWVSVSVPPSLTPLLGKLMDEIEKAPGGSPGT